MKTLQGELRRTIGKATGTSYGSVWSYVNGQAPAEPRQKVVEGMADLLAVRSAYLMFGDEPRTEAEAAALAQATAVADARAGRESASFTLDSKRFEAVLLEGLPALSNAGPASWHALGDLYAQFSRHHSADILGPATFAALDRVADGEAYDQQGHLEDLREAQAQAARKMVEAVAGSAVAAGIDLSQHDRWEIDRYIQTTVQALSILLRDTELAGLDARRRKQRASEEGGDNAEA